jgi:hypothetical protein
MATIAMSVQQVGDIISQISSASAEQASGLNEVSEAIVQMDQVTQRNSTLVEEAADAARTLQMQALTLSRAVAAFRLDEAVSVDAPPPEENQSAVRKSSRLVTEAGAQTPAGGERRKHARPHLHLASRRD